MRGLPTMTNSLCVLLVKGISAWITFTIIGYHYHIAGHTSTSISMLILEQDPVQDKVKVNITCGHIKQNAQTYIYNIYRVRGGASRSQWAAADCNSNYQGVICSLDPWGLLMMICPLLM